MTSVQEIMKDQPAHIQALAAAINQGNKDTMRDLLSAFAKREGGSGGGQGESCCSSCATGGPCEGEGVCPGTPPAFVLPECYRGCKTISKCLMAFYRDARLRSDSNAWLEYNKREIPLVHLNRNVGTAPQYNVVPFPITAGQNVMLMQEMAQWLPYEPGFFKVDLTWAGGPPANQAVTIRLWTGDYSVTTVTDPNTDGLIQVGRDLSLSDFTSSPADSGGGCCWFLPYPEIYGCEEAAIPNGRRVFFEIRAGAIGPAQLTQFSVDIVKRHTKKFSQMCKQYGLELM